MDFFESQDLARRNTRFLLFLFALAVLSLVVLTNVMVYFFSNYLNTSAALTGQLYYSWQTFAMVSVAVVLLVFLASAFRMLALRKGGSAIAELMDGELVVTAGGDLNRQKLLNVVEEMAIASGTPVPPVYIINEPGINAFAAGYSASDAVIGITQGAIENLSRDELQGVIAHEFSHILNGDMRLNIRLMGVLYGILMLAILGRIILQPARHGAVSRDKTHAAVLAMGVGLMAIGYIGQFFGNLIKAAVSRQREYLADASAVQFTRDPSGIAGALKRIGGYAPGSKLSHPESEELSHSFFAEGISFSFSSLMATHPPLTDRIQRIDPRWDGGFQLENTPDAPSEPTLAGVSGFNSAGVTQGANFKIDSAQVISSIGNPSETQISIARQMIGALPQVMSDAAHEAYSARALVYLLLLDSKQEVRQIQLQHLEKYCDLGVFDALTTLMKAESQLQPSMRLTLLEMALPTLRQLSYEQYKLLLANIDTLIRADGRIGLAEWALQKMVVKHLGEVFEANHSKVKHQQLESVTDHCAILLSMLAYCDKHATESPEVLFTAGQQTIELDIRLIEKSSLSFNKLNDALDTLATLHPLRKPKLLKACIQTITADNAVSIIEAELMRTIADTLECPMPPLHSENHPS